MAPRPARRARATVVRPRGRPRDAATDAAIVRAAVDLINESGVQGTTLAAVARRAGVARATVYLRWPSRSALIGAAARSAVGGRPMVLSGTIADDIRAAATFIQRVFAGRSFPAILPELIRGLLANPPELSFDEVVPRRRAFGQEYRERATAEGFNATLDPHLAFDLLLGSAISYLLATRRPMSKAAAERLAEVVIDGLRTPSAGPTSGGTKGTKKPARGASGLRSAAE